MRLRQQEAICYSLRICKCFGAEVIASAPEIIVSIVTLVVHQNLTYD